MVNSVATASFRACTSVSASSWVESGEKDSRSAPSSQDSTKEEADVLVSALRDAAGSLFTTLS